MRRLPLVALLCLGLSSGAFAQTTCPDLTTLQVWAGYLSWLGLFKVLGALVFAGGVFVLFGDIILRVLFSAKVLIEAAGYALSVALIAGGSWVQPEYLTWTVFLGCILFMGTVFLTLTIHEIKGDDPKLLAALFMAVWGAVAVYYNLPEVGVLAILALMTLLGFTVIIGRLSYGFGWDDDKQVAPGTTGALLVVAAYIAEKVFMKNAPAYVTVFETGAFYAATIVGFTGLLILSSRWWTKGAHYVVMQMVTIAIYLAALAIGMTFNINPLAGTAGTLLVFYLAAKPLEVPKHSIAGFGLALMASGAIMFGAWYLAMQKLDIVKQYLTAAL